jgi:hypothetical protein
METEYSKASQGRSVQTTWLSKGKMRLMVGLFSCCPGRKIPAFVWGRIPQDEVLTMAIARCEKCGKPTASSVKPPGYSERPYFPVGHPASGIVCGKPLCANDGLIWLKADEVQMYQRGRRIFNLLTQAVKVRVQ